jgi:hypothetical protein
MAAPQQPRSVTIVADLGLKSDPNMHRAHGGSFRVRIEARHEWVESRIFRKLTRPDQCPGTMRMRRVLRDRMACGSKESDPPFPFPPRESRGGEGSPHAAARSAPAQTAGTAHAAAPPARGLRPLARSPKSGLSRDTPPAGRPRRQDDRTRKRIKDGRHVVLDFYDLLIEPTMKRILSGVLTSTSREDAHTVGVSTADRID